MIVVGAMIAAVILILGVAMIVAAYRRTAWVDRVIRQILDEHDRDPLD